MDPKRIYVAGPISDGGKIATGSPESLKEIDGGIFVGSMILGLGHIPFIPHLSHWWDIRMKEWAKDTLGIRIPTHEDWLEMDLHWIAVCDAMYRIPRPSKGADMEVEYCRGIDKPVFTEWEKLVEWLEVPGTGLGMAPSPTGSATP